MVMSPPLRISFRDMDSTPSLDAAIQEGVAKLERIYDRIERIDVTVDRPHQRHRSGQHIHVRITLAIPGPDVIVSHQGDLDAAHEDAYIAIRDAFDAARRQLEHHVERLRGDAHRRTRTA
jgi:ribosomal subunit interface protein